MTTHPDTVVDMVLDAKGRLVPRRLVKEIDFARDAIVRELCDKARELSAVIGKFKGSVMADIQAFVELSGEQYGAHLGGQKGNVTLLSYDGTLKVTRQIADKLTFDERLQAAKAVIDECIEEWSTGSRDEILTLVGHAFQVDKEGKLSVERILGLRRLQIEDPKWREAMRAIGDSIQVVERTAYVRFYERVGENGGWRPISLDIATVEAT